MERLWWHGSFGENLLFSNIVFPEICFDAWYQFRDIFSIVFILPHTRAVISRPWYTFQQSSLSNPRNHLALLCRGLSASALAYQCHFGTTVIYITLLLSIYWRKYSLFGCLTRHCRPQLQNPEEDTPGFASRWSSKRPSSMSPRTNKNSAALLWGVIKV